MTDNDDVINAIDSVIVNIEKFNENLDANTEELIRDRNFYQTVISAMSFGWMVEELNVVVKITFRAAASLFLFFVFALFSFLLKLILKLFLEEGTYTNNAISYVDNTCLTIVLIYIVVSSALDFCFELKLKWILGSNRKESTNE